MLKLPWEGNQNDPKLLAQTIASIDSHITQPRYKKMRLDGIHDSEEVRTILFNNDYLRRINPNNRRRIIKQKYAYIDEPPLRWVIERSHFWVNRYRRILIWWEKSLENYTAMLQFAFSLTISNKLRI